jgi:hypothetical protein
MHRTITTYKGVEVQHQTFLTSEIWWRWIVRFTLPPIYPWTDNLRHALDKRQGLDHSSVGLRGFITNTNFLAYFSYVKRRLMRSPCCLCVWVSSPNNSFACVFVATRTCLPSCWLATSVSSGSAIPAFRHHVTLHSKVDKTFSGYQQCQLFKNHLRLSDHLCSHHQGVTSGPDDGDRDGPRNVGEF